jgi:hypothetical protein
MRGEKVTVLVGEAREEFTISKGLISERSKWFANALDGRFKEGRESVIELPEDDPKAFTAFFFWIHANDLYFEELDSSRLSASRDSLVQECNFNLCIW